MDKNRILVLDTETTGFTKNDEILQLSIIDGKGVIVLNEYFCPQHVHSWESAEQVNHISPAMVADKPGIQEEKNRIENILSTAEVIVGYNLPFDLEMLIQNGITIPPSTKVRYLDLMKPFARIYSEHHAKYPDQFKNQKLITCAKYYNYPKDNWHDSLADARATLYCFWEMVKRKGIEI